MIKSVKIFKLDEKIGSVTKELSLWRKPLKTNGLGAVNSLFATPPKNLA